jgi:hypothetical protein
MRLWTPEGAGRARRFYEREGWRLTGRSHPASAFGLTTVEYERSTSRGLPHGAEGADGEQ